EQALEGAMPLPEASLRWILAQRGVTAVIPGASSGEQARANAAAGSAPSAAQQEVLQRFDAPVLETYDALLGESIHPCWVGPRLLRRPPPPARRPAAPAPAAPPRRPARPLAPPSPARPPTPASSRSSA